MLLKNIENSIIPKNILGAISIFQFNSMWWNYVFTIPFVLQSSASYLNPRSFKTDTGKWYKVVYIWHDLNKTWPISSSDTCSSSTIILPVSFASHDTESKSVRFHGNEIMNLWASFRGKIVYIDIIGQRL